MNMIVFYLNKIKWFQATLLLIGIFFLVSCQPSSQKNIQGKDYIKISEKYPRYFENGIGKPWIPVMINFIMPNGSEDKVFNEVERYFKNFSENGGNSVRIWISSAFLEIEDEVPGQFNPVKFNRVDSLLELATKYDLKIKFTLEHIRSIDPNPERRRSWSNRAILSNELSGDFKNINEYITTRHGNDTYLNRVKALAKKYRDNDQIFGWELWNEMDAVHGYDWYAFSNEILDSVKVLFPNHLVTQTLGSLHSKDAEARYERFFTLQNNDYIPIHRYLDPGNDWDQYDLVRQPADLIAGGAVKFAYRDSLMKPVVMNEIGAVEANHAGPSHLYVKDTLGILLHDMLFAPFFCGAAGGGSMWHWNVYIDRQGLWYHYKLFSDLVGKFDPVNESFYPFSFNTNSTRIYGLKGNKHTLIWCRDTTNNWETEFVDEVVPKEKSDLEINLSQMNLDGDVKVKAYNPWSGIWSDLAVQDRVLNVPPFKRSVVLVFESM